MSFQLGVGRRISVHMKKIYKGRIKWQNDVRMEGYSDGGLSPAIFKNKYVANVLKTGDLSNKNENGVLFM